MIQTPICAHALAKDVDKALKGKPGGGTLDEEHEETNNGSGGALPIGGGEPEALPEAVATVIAKTGATEDEQTKMDAFVAQCWRKVDMYASLAQESTSTTAMPAHIKAHNVNTKRSERQPSESKLRSFVLFNYDMKCAGEASAHPSTHVPPLRGKGDHLKQCVRAALDAVNDTRDHSSRHVHVVRWRPIRPESAAACRVHSARWNLC